MNFVKATSIDDAIQHCLDVVEEKKNKADKYNRWDEWESVYADDCIQCATDHQQLAEWLMELKDLRAEQNDQYIFIKELMDEIKEAKRLLKLAIEDIYHARQGWSCSICDMPKNAIDVEKRCEVDNVQPNCKYRWQYANEVEKLLNDKK